MEGLEALVCKVRVRVITEEWSAEWESLTILFESVVSEMRSVLDSKPSSKEKELTAKWEEQMKPFRVSLHQIGDRRDAMLRASYKDQSC